MRFNLRNSFYIGQMQYVLKSISRELMRKKIGTFLTILVIAASLTMPIISYLLWKNTHNAATQFYPDSELTIYLDKNLNDNEVNQVVEQIRNQEGVESLNYISRQESLNDFKSWSSFGSELEMLDDNPLPAVVMVKPTEEYNQSQRRSNLQDRLGTLSGVQEVRIDNEWAEKLMALTKLFSRISTICTFFMVLAICLVIGNSIRTDIYSSRAEIEVKKILGATDQFILRIFLYTGMLYGFLGGLLACIFTSFVVLYLSSIVKGMADIFAVKFEFNGLYLSEFFFIMIFCIAISYLSAWITAKKHI